MPDDLPESDHRREDRLRRLASRKGLSIVKSRRRAPAQCGGYMIIDRSLNCIVAGWKPFAFSLDLDTVEQLLTDR